MSLEDNKKAALAFVNERRKEAGLRATGRLSKGYPQSSTLCTIAKSLEAVGVLRAGRTREGRVYLQDGQDRERIFESPETVRFMEDFDCHKYPELVIKPKPIKIAGKVVLHGDQ